jgi:hypothetical protein
MPEDRKYVVKKELKLEDLKMELLLNAAGDLKANEVTAPDLLRANRRVTRHLAFAPIKESEGTEMEIAWVKAGTPGAVEVTRNWRQKTIVFPFDPVLTLYPGLTVDPGYVRHLNCRLDETGPEKRFIVSLVGTEVEPATDAFGRRNKRKQPPDSTQTNNSASK